MNYVATVRSESAENMEQSKVTVKQDINNAQQC